jgi:transcriptional regulator with XRE-family HTH domain
MAYSKLDQQEIADRMGDLVSKRTLERWAKDGIPLRMKHAGQAMQRLAAAADLPEAFFYVDLQRLPELLAGDGAAATSLGVDREALVRARQAAGHRAGRPDAERRQGPQDRRTG